MCVGIGIARLRFITKTAKLSPIVEAMSQRRIEFWQGAVQAMMTCPSANVNNVFLGQFELTGKPTGAFTTASYNVPSSVQAALAQTGSCHFTLGVNSNATPTPIVLDNLRFSL